MEDIKEILLITILFILFIVGMFWGLNQINKKSCLTAYDTYKPVYTFWSGCRIEWDGKLTPVEIIREINYQPNPAPQVTLKTN